MTEVVEQKKREWLRELRKEKGLTTRELGEVFGVTYQYISDIETGRRNPSIELSLKMAVYFGFPVEKLFEARTKFKK